MMSVQVCVCVRACAFCFQGQNQRFKYPPFSAVEALGRALSCSSVTLFSLRGEKNHPSPSPLVDTDPPPFQERVPGVFIS